MMTTISIKGMNCPHCVASTTKALEDITGLSNITVDLEKKQASYDGDVSLEKVKEAISKIGFEIVD